MKTLSFILAIILFPCFAFGAPTISSISGTIVNGQSITISGSDFLTKSTAGPVLSSYDNATAANNISNGSIGGEWSTRASTTLGSSASYKRTPFYQNDYYVDCPYVSDDYSQFRYDGSSSLGNYFYTSMWYYITRSMCVSCTGSRNSKFWRWYVNPAGTYGGTVSENYNTGGASGGCGSGCEAIGNLVGHDGGQGDLDNYGGLWPTQEWVHHEVYVYAGSSGGTDGFYREVVNGKSVRNWTGWGIINASYPHTINYFRFGQVSGINHAGESILLSDVYIDNTPSHVFISDKSNIPDWLEFSDWAHNEIQVPSAWATDEITVTVNQGSITNLLDGNHYLYVVDSAGAISNAYQISGKSVAITGTGSSGMTEAEVVTGGKTFIGTVTGDTLVATFGADNQFTTDFIAGIDSGGAEAGGWDAKVKADITYAMVDRDSDTQFTVTLPATADYEITTNETITITVPANCLTGAAQIITSPTVEVTASNPVATLSGTLSDNATEAQIVTGGETLIITLSDDTWVADDGTFDAQRQNIIDGMDSAQSEATGWNAEVRDKMAVGVAVRTNDTTCTITLTAAAAYDISANETITMTVPASALVTSDSPLTGTPAYDVIFFDTSTEKCTGMTLQ